MSEITGQNSGDFFDRVPSAGKTSDK